jgi:hypothetical protein
MNPREQFIEKAKKIHGNKYDYSLVDYKNAKKKIKIICSKKHIFEQIPNDHLNGHGCKICAGWGVLKYDNNNLMYRIKEIHGDNYDYSHINYTDHDEKIKLICPKHGEFYKSPKNLLIQKQGCPKCGYEKSTKKRIWGKDKFVEKAIKIHGNKYDYSLVNYINAVTKVKIICKKHGEFNQCPKDHINQKQGCILCCQSKGERLVESLLNDLNLTYIREASFEDLINPKTDCKLYLDFYIPEKNIAIEYDGIQHFKSLSFFGGDEGLEDVKFTQWSGKCRQRNSFEYGSSL